MRKTIVIALALALGGCGSSPAPTTTTTTTTVSNEGGDAPAPCSVPNSPAEAVFADANRAARAEDYPRAIALYEQACEQGNACACTERGEASVDSPMGTHDPATGVPFLERGCEGGDDWGCYWFAYAIWRYLPDRADRVPELLANACDNGVPDACMELGRFEVTGVTAAPTPADAIPLYTRACENGARFACYMLGQAHAVGIGTPRDPDRATELLTWSCNEAEIPQACTAWADLLDTDDQQRAALLSRACQGGDPFACDETDPTAARQAGDAPLTTIATNRPAAVAVPDGDHHITATMGGDVPLRSLGLRPSCVGFVGTAPTAVLNVPENVLELQIRAHAPADTILVVRDPGGHWLCADDGLAGNFDATIELDDPTAGELLVWAGMLRPGTVDGQINIVTDAPPTPVAIETLRAGRPENLTVPTRPMHFYQLQASTVPGVAGTVFLDGQPIWSFDRIGGMATLPTVQCALRPGRHTMEIAVTQRRASATALEGQPLIRVDLHGLEAEGITNDESRAFRVEWSPDAPARRAFAFRLSARQGGDQTGICAPPQEEPAAAAPGATAPPAAAAAPGAAARP
jgi:hypothetical protein